MSRLFPFAALCLAAATALAADAGSPPPAKPAKPPALKAIDPNAAAKQDTPAFFGFFGPVEIIQKHGFRSAVGRWAEYRLKDGGTLRFQEVGPAVPGARWIELVSKGSIAGDAGLRMLARGDGDGNVERMIAQTGLLPTLELPMDRMTLEDEGEPVAPGAPIKPQPLELVGREKTPVPAGLYDTVHYRMTAGSEELDYWVTADPKVPFAGLVKFVMNRQLAELTAVGTDATSKVAVPPKN